LADADYLRRGMSWKFKQRNEFWRVKEKFFNNCLEKKYDPKVINDIWVQIESFANFAFSKGHSASYAVESYQALYLKAYYPLEYMVATLNNGGGFYRKDVYIHEARMHGATIVPPCINTSTMNCEIKGSTIFLGFDLVNELEKKLVEKIIEERNSGGAYTSLYNFVKRTAISIEQLRILIRSGAFGSMNKNKKELLWEAHMLINPIKHQSPSRELFEIEPQKFKLPQLENTWLDDAFDEIELFGFSLCHPFKLLKEPVKNKLTSPDLKKHVGETVEIIGHLVNVKTTWASNKEKMYFGTFLDEEGYWIDTVHFPPSAKTHPFTGPGSYRIIGKVTEEFDFVCIDVLLQSRLPMISKDDAPVMLPPRSRRERIYQRG
jgi:DNA polymerase III subunit alpha